MNARRLFPLLFITILLCSCEDKPAAASALTLDKTDIIFGPSGGFDTIKVKSSGKWIASILGTETSWLLLQSEADRIIVTANPNFDSNDTLRKIQIAVPGVEKKIVTVRLDRAMAPAQDKTCPRDAVLMYFGTETSTQGVPTVERMLLYTQTNEAKPRWFFDGFIMGATDTDSGKTFGSSTDPAKIASQEDWEERINYHCDKTLTLLDSATVLTARNTGVYAHKQKVIFTIPLPNHYAQSWGKINGAPVNMSSAQGKVSAAKWFIDKAIEKYNAKGFKNLELVGFYWYHEALALNSTEHYSEDMICAVADYIHSKGLDFFWIPYSDIDKYSNARLEKWRSYKIDHVYYQPNYYFREKLTKDDLIASIRKAHAAGVGMELEMDWKATTMYSGSDRSMYYNKVVDYIKAYDSLGVWANDNVAYYEYHSVERIARPAANEAEKALYALLAKFIGDRQATYYDIKY